MKKKIIDPSDDQFGEMLNSALRYALGRMSYIVEDTANYIRPLLPHLSDRTLWAMEKDLKEQAAMNFLGMKMDAEVWTALLADIENELKSREESE